MTQSITAIYENGLLRPMIPLQLPEHIQVQIIVKPVMHSVKKSNKPTMVELLAELREINRLEPIEIEIPPRQDRQLVGAKMQSIIKEIARKTRITFNLKVAIKNVVFYINTLNKNNCLIPYF